MTEATKDKNFDIYKIGEKTYHKASFGPKTWSSIQENMPGQKVDFVDVLHAKFEKALEKSIDIHK